LDQPQVFYFAEGGDQEAAADLRKRLADLGASRPFVVASQHGFDLARHVTDEALQITPPGGATTHWAAEAGLLARRSDADVVVAVGGGRALDLAKLVAARAGLTVVTAPTQLAHDGICSPVAVVPNPEGRIESIGTITPRAVFISLPLLLEAPQESVAAGLGDLLANPLALRDWALAAERGLDRIDQRAWELSVQSYELVEPILDSDGPVAARDLGVLRTLADALILSGTAMISSGTSRPASGAEHEISHAIDELFGGRALHGAQVAFGCIVSVGLYGEDTEKFRARLRHLGLPQHPRDLGLDRDDMIRVLLRAPETRPGRFTILEDAELDESRAGALIDGIWGRD
jgi:glycerol-1-phosphate dehydrogenase [NAD(P)+]